MLVFGAGAAIALGSTFFAYVRRTVRLQAPDRVPLRVTLWWLSVLAAIAAAAFFLIGLNMRAGAVLQERPGISSGAKVKGETQRKHGSRKKRDGRMEGKRDQRNEHENEDEEEHQQKQGSTPTPGRQPRHLLQGQGNRNSELHASAPGGVSPPAVVKATG